MRNNKKRIVLILILFMTALLTENTRLHAGSSTVIGKSSTSDPVSKRIIPAIDLPMPATEQAKNYLGLSGTGSFRIGQIKAQTLIIQVFSYY